MRLSSLLNKLIGTSLVSAAFALGTVSPAEAVMATLDVVQPGQRSMGCGGNIHGLNIDFESMDEPLDSMSIRGLESLQGCFNSLGWDRDLEILSDYVTVVPGMGTRHWVLLDEATGIPAGTAYYRRVFTFNIDRNGRIISFTESAIEEFAPLAIQNGMSMEKVQEVLLNLNPHHIPFFLGNVYSPEGEVVESTNFVQEWAKVIGLTLDRFWREPFATRELTAHILDEDTFLITWDVHREGGYTEGAVVMENPEGVWVSAPLSYFSVRNPGLETPEEATWHALRAMGLLEEVTHLLPIE